VSIPVILLIMLLPITINGLGTGQAAFLDLRRGRRQPARRRCALGPLHRPRHRRQPARRAAVTFWWRRPCLIGGQSRDQVHAFMRPPGSLVDPDRAVQCEAGWTPSPRSTLALVAAAGRGTRLGFHLPKVLFPVEGRPLLELLGSRLSGLAGSVTLVLSPGGADASTGPDTEAERASRRD
jgi:hypothetical protein